MRLRLATPGFDLKNPVNTSAGNFRITKYKKIPCNSIPQFIKDKLKEIEKKGHHEAAATIKTARKRKEKLTKHITRCDDEIKK